MTNDEVRDPQWLPEDVGTTHGERVDTSFVDSLRAFRSHREEWETVGPTRALSLVKSLSDNYICLARRVQAGLDPVLAAAPTSALQVALHCGVSNVASSLGVALHSSPSVMGATRHLIRSVMPPQAALSLDGAMPTMRGFLALRGWRTAILHRMRCVYDQLVNALRTLASTLPAGSGLSPANYGVALHAAYPNRSSLSAPSDIQSSSTGHSTHGSSTLSSASELD